MTYNPSPQQDSQEADFAEPGLRRQPPKRWAVLVAWTWPVAFQFLVWFVIVLPNDPHMTLWIRTRTFVRGIVGAPSHVLFSLKLIDPNDLWTHVIMAAIIWPILLVAVTLTPPSRLPLAAHMALSIAWTLGGCCLVLGI